MKQVFIIIFFMLCYNCCGFAQQEITFRGNRFSMSQVDTVTIVDPVTGQATTQIISPRPLRVNDKKIYSIDTLRNLPFLEVNAEETEKLSVYLFNHLSTEIDSLDDGNYIFSINNAVIDDKGRLVYYEFNGLKRLLTTTVFTSPMPGKSIMAMNNIVYGIIRDTTVSDHTIYDSVSNKDIATSKKYDNAPARMYSREEIKQTDGGISQHLISSINAATQKLLDHLPKMKAAQLNHVSVSCVGPVFSVWNYIIVKDHKAAFTPFYESL